MSHHTADQPDGQWWLVDDYGDGKPVVGPFGSCSAAVAHDPTDDQLEPVNYPHGLAAGRPHLTETYEAGTAPRKYGWRCSCGAATGGFTWADQARSAAYTHTQDPQ